MRELFPGIDYYIDASGFYVFTEKFIDLYCKLLYIYRSEYANIYTMQLNQRRTFKEE